ncbi:hypothetical protein EVG20_g2954 [Dentipellis fragilis]|uniref:Uncharacterized protein n=1 Tax=Dentipellis fragilis TaxID=205917 RepID=A0A4Y9Z597_9AGAM|nr:hypothetical protein EVG20_g2954 [Dentipellis fragilis]
MAAATSHILAEPHDTSNTVILHDKSQYCGTGDDVTIGSRIHYNRVYTVCRFPAEILEYIFLTTIADQPSTIPPNISPEFTTRQPWLALLTHVCTRWRAICLEAPRLWTRTCISDYLSKKWRIVFMRRSGSVPLHIRLSGSRSDTIQEEILSHLHRVQVLHLADLFNNARHFVERLWTQSAPVLTELHLGFVFLHAGRSPFTWPTSIHDFAPRLQVLTIYSVSGRYTLPCLFAAENLTHFDVDLKLDLSKALKCLHRNSQISFFRTSTFDSTAGVHTAPHSPPSTEPAIIILPQLRTLVIRLESDSFSHKLAFLQHIKARSLRRLIMTPLHEDLESAWPVPVDDVGTRVNLVKLIAPHLSTMRDNIGPLRSFSLTIQSGEGISFLGSVDLPLRWEAMGHRVVAMHEEDLPQILLQTDWNNTEPASETVRFVRTACHLWPLSDVRVLSMDALDVSVSTDEWRAILGPQFSRVTELHFFNTLPSLSLLRACTPGDPSTFLDVHVTQMDPFIFPLLTKIVIDYPGALMAPVDTLVEHHIYAAILALAISRGQHNSPVAFELHGCKGLALPIAALQGVAEVSVLEGRAFN